MWLFVFIAVLIYLLRVSRRAAPSAGLINVLEDVNLDEDFGLRRVCFSEVKWWIYHARYEQSCSKVKENKLKPRQNKLSIF